MSARSPDDAPLLRILFLAANPDTTTLLDAGPLAEVLRSALRASSAPDATPSSSAQPAEDEVADDLSSSACP